MVFNSDHLVKKIIMKKFFFALIENVCHCCGYNSVHNTFSHKLTISAVESKKVTQKSLKRENLTTK